jgi:predicted Zn-dependent protease
MAQYPQALQQQYRKAIAAIEAGTPERTAAVKALRQFATARRYPSLIAFSLGVLHLEQKEIVQAEHWFRKAVGINPANGGNNAMLAFTLVQQNKVESAIPLPEAPCRTNPPAKVGEMCRGIISTMISSPIS